MNSSATLYNSIDEIMNEALKTVKHKVSDFNINNRSLEKNNKGVIGQIVEEGVFHYPINSNHEADFANLGIELKVTGLKLLKNKHLAMKERLVLNIINYMDEANVDFNHSSFYIKCKKMLLLFYLYDANLDNFDFNFIGPYLHEFAPEDLAIIKNDWEIIHHKIIEGDAHNISEADTMYLGACTKGAGGVANLRNQPFSDIKAKQRAFCLKTSYMNTIVDALYNNENNEHIFTYDQLKKQTFEYLIENRLSKYIGKFEDELFNMFELDKTSKSRFNLLVGKMLNIKGVINKTDEFKKGNIELKTIRVEEDGYIREHMSFPYFKYTELYQEEWEDSQINELFSTKKFMFVIFKKKGTNYYFDSIKFWNMPYEDIEEFVKPIFEITKNCISSGNIVKEEKDNKYITNFPGSKYNGVCHVRPHDQKSIRSSNSGLDLPVPDRVTGLTKYTKYCFWLDKKYIQKIIEKNKN